MPLEAGDDGRQALEVRRAARDDLPALAEILLAMERHYEPESLSAAETALARIDAALFGPAPLAAAFLAVADGEVVGVAVVSWLFPTKSFRPGLFLKDMFVAPAWRRRGIARALLAALARFAAEHGHPRIDWTADRDNEAAAHLYRSLGARIEDKLFFRLREDGYERFIARAGTATRND